MNFLLQNFFSIKFLKVRFKNKKISLFSLFDKKCFIHKNSKINRFVILRDSSVDAYSFIGPNSRLINAKVGKFCSISKNVNIGSFVHPIGFVSTNPIFYREINGTGTSWVKGIHFDDISLQTIIGNDVWIGMNVTIMGGVKIGNGAIIGAHAVVTKDIPPYAVVGGIPAKIIKFRFDETIIKQLLQLKWWDLPDDFLKSNALIFANEVNNEFISKIKSKKVKNQ